MTEEAPAPMSIRARIEALRLAELGPTPDSPPPPYDNVVSRKAKPPPPPPLPKRPQSTNNPPLLSNGTATGRTIGNQPARPHSPPPTPKGVLPAPTFKKWEKSEPTPALPPRRPSQPSSGRPIPPLPPRRPSEQSLTRKQSTESVSSIASGRSSISGVSTRTSFSISSRDPGGPKPRVRAPEYDPASLPPLPEKRVKNEQEKENGRLSLRPTNSAPNGISRLSRQPSFEPPSLPVRPPLPTRRDTPLEQPPKPKRSALEWGMNKASDTPPPLPGSRPTNKAVAIHSNEPALTELTAQNFDSVILHSGKPAFVDFFAHFCGPCKELAPIYEQLAEAFHHSNITIAKIDSYENKEIGTRYDVQGWPTLKFFDGKGGDPVDYRSYRTLEAMSEFITKQTGIRPGARPSVSNASAPPPVPVASRPNLAELQKSKPKPGATGATRGQCLKCRDFSGPDNHAARFPRQSILSQDINWLAHQLCDPFPSATDKARAIFTWLHHNIEYNTVAFYSGNLKPSTPNSTLSTGLAVCEGYAALFTALATVVGLESVVVGGHGKGTGYTPPAGGGLPPKSPTGHAWNAVKIDNGAWKLIDPCWGAGNVQDAHTPYQKDFHPDWFVMTNDEFGIKHYPEDERWFLREDGRRSITWEEYMLSDAGPQKCLVYSPAKTEHGLDDNSFEPKFMDIKRNDPAGGPTVRFMFHKICPHYDIVAKHGQPHLFYLKLDRPGRGEEFRVFKTDGYFWWADVTREELAFFKDGNVIVTYVTHYDRDKKDARGITEEQFQRGVKMGSPGGWGGYSMSHVAMWKVV